MTLTYMLDGAAISEILWPTWLREHHKSGAKLNSVHFIPQTLCMSFLNLLKGHHIVSTVNILLPYSPQWNEGQIWELNILIFTHHTVCLISVTVCSYSLGLLRTSLEDVWSWSRRPPHSSPTPHNLFHGAFPSALVKTLFPGTSKCGKTSSWFPVL